MTEICINRNKSESLRFIYIRIREETKAWDKALLLQSMHSIILVEIPLFRNALSHLKKNYFNNSLLILLIRDSNSSSSSWIVLCYCEHLCWKCFSAVVWLMMTLQMVLILPLHSCIFHSFSVICVLESFAPDALTLTTLYSCNWHIFHN